jgi:dephospho-CoA kinase
MLYNGIFEFAKAQNKYYSESTAHSRGETYTYTKKDVASLKLKNILNKDSIEKHKKSYLITQNIIKEMSTMLADTINKNYILTMENKMLSNEKKHEVLAEAEKNRKDPHHREQLMKYCLIMFAGFLLFGLINYL